MVPEVGKPVNVAAPEPEGNPHFSCMLGEVSMFTEPLFKQRS